MPSRKHLSAVAHDIAHHAVSGLSYLHPYLGEVCQTTGAEEITLDPSRASPLPVGCAAPQPLALSSANLHRTFLGILQAKGFVIEDVSTAELRFVFPTNRKDNYSCVCFSRLTSSDGDEFAHRLSSA